MDYVHEPTHELRQSLIYNHDEYDVPEDQPLVLVPNFRTFTSSFSAPRSRLFFLSDRPTKLLVQTLSLRNVATGYVEEIRLETTYETQRSLKDTDFQKDSSLQEDTGWQVGYVPLFAEDQVDYEEFRDAEELEVTVTYSQDGGAVRQEVLVLRLVKLSKTAWAT
ncbi:MAG: hypothetical protein K8J08_18965 [Thermoanaerobaculia bacterium]|nr:hypothetical protein [Thermoanaerobaculia bacterium]